MVKNINDKILNRELMKIIFKTYFYCGFEPPNEKTLEFQIMEIVKDLKEYFPGFTVAEIEKSFELGAKNELCEWVGLSVATYHKWLNSFRYSQHRQKLIQNNLPALPPPRKPSAEEIDLRMTTFALKAFSEFKATRTFEDIGNSVYNFLDEKKMIPFTNERKKQIYEQAKAKVLIEKNNQKSDLHKNYFGKMQIAKEIEKIRKDESELTKIAAKKEALKIFFSDLIEMGEELKFGELRLP